MKKLSLRICAEYKEALEALANGDNRKVPLKIFKSEKLSDNEYDFEIDIQDFPYFLMALTEIAFLNKKLYTVDIVMQNVEPDFVNVYTFTPEGQILDPVRRMVIDKTLDDYYDELKNRYDFIFSKCMPLNQ